MTDRIRVLTVYLEEDIRKDDVEPILAAIRQLRYVARVDAVVTPPERHLAIETAKMDLRKQLYEAFKGVMF